MIKHYYTDICDGIEVRANLIALKNEIKEEAGKRALAYLLGGDFSVLSSLLQADDPKIRKNAALILGQMESEDLLPILFDAYQNEETKFIRADYLKAISNMDYRGVLGSLKEQLAKLRNSENTVEDSKHIAEETRILQAMILKYQKYPKHKFTGYHEKTDCILVTNRCQRECTAQQIPAPGQVVMLAGGLRVKNVELGDVLPIRTYTECLLPIPIKKGQQLSAEYPEEIGANLVQTILDMLCSLHSGKPPFLFRIELKGSIPSDKRGAFIRKISDSLEQKSDGQLINSVGDYEIELRLLEKKDSTFVPMMKLYTIPDKRFVYRKEFVAASIAPVNAALCTELAKPYMKENAQILDPFCGVGTMLIERNKAVPAKTMYGLDIYGEAIEKARVNTFHAGYVINYINRDFFDFTHEYLFDEVISNMPQIPNKREESDLKTLYTRFFRKVLLHLNESAVLILHTQEPSLLRNVVRQQTEFHIEKSYLLNEKNNTTLFIIKRV